jgi:hypothetical protein
MAMALHTNPPSHNDNRRVALIKSLATNNRFYALVTPESGIRNADTVEKIPGEILLGIAYPCLEDGLNDFAVIRTTYETLDFFPEEDEMRKELMEIITEARVKLVKRLSELQERIAARKAHFLGTDLDEFKAYAWDIVHRGYPRRNLDSMMKLNVFGSVSEAEGHADGSEPLYRYEFRNPGDIANLSQQPARQFIASLFGDVLESVRDDANYKSKYTFDRNVFQKFIALMFVNYATTDPMFYGTNRADYGVSEEKDMDSTPLYMAVARELREIEVELAAEDRAAAGLPAEEPVTYEPASRIEDGHTVELPGMLVNEDVLLGPIGSICAAALQIAKRDDHESSELARIIIAESSRLVQELKRLNIVSPFAYDPGANHSEDGEPGEPHSQDGP